MAKLRVVDSDRQSSTPFLRGILIRRLQDSGLGFEDAYALATDVRSEFDGVPEISSDDLHELVLRRLTERFGDEAGERYLSASPALTTLMVRQVDDTLLPFSRSQLRRQLEASGLEFEDTLPVVSEVYDGLIRTGRSDFDAAEVGRRTFDRLSESIGDDAARRYLAWTDFQRSDRPLLILIGGVPGCGKSTIASELAHRLEAPRVQSTDMLREVMRMMVSKQLLPALHTSSFLAWQTLPTLASGAGPAQPQQLAEGYLAQYELLSLACEGAIHRTLRERVSLILEGVHVHPSLVSHVPSDADAIVVPIMLAVLKRGMLKRRLLGRGRQASGRRAERYLEHFDAIWELQSFLLSEADRLNVPIITNVDKDSVTRQITRLIGDELLMGFDATPETVFD